MAYNSRTGIISIFARHPVAANLLMLIMLFSGLWAIKQLNTQFLPTFKINYVDIYIAWPGASAQDVETSLVIPIEQDLRSLDYLKEMTSAAQLGSAYISLEYPQGTDMSAALDQVKERVSLVRNLPSDIETPEITKVENFEAIGRILLTGPQNIEELRPLAYKIEHELLNAGIAKVKIIGLPEKMVAIQVSSAQLAESHLSLPQIAERISKRSQDIPAGTIGRGDTAQQLRSLDQKRSVQAFENINLASDTPGRLVRLGDVADVKLIPQDDEVIVNYKEQQAVELIIYRTEAADALKMAEVFHNWLDANMDQLPQGVQLEVYDESWRLINQRINLLLKNGGTGLILILMLLFLLLNKRVAFWVAMGIPASFMAALAALYFLGGSINMVSLFAMIMALGIIVDDTIVVGEESLTQLTKGKPVIEAVEIGAKKMLAPVMASSLTTICAFLPLLLVGNIIGTILKAIPIVVVCIIIASLIECFLVLPGHLYHSFRKIQVSHDSAMRKAIDDKFYYFREKVFRRIITMAIRHRALTLCAALAAIIITVGLFMGGRVNFTFFPSPDGTTIHANAQFTAGTPPEKMATFLDHMEHTLWQVDKQYRDENNEDMVEVAVTFQNRGAFQRGNGSNLASMVIELSEPDSRKMSNDDFIDIWREQIKQPAGLESLIISSPRAGPPGEDLDIQLIGNDPRNIKLAALELRNILQGYSGVSDVEDNLPYGQQQVIFELTPEGESLNLTIDEVGRQLRASFTGALAQVYHQGNDEIEVRVLLPEEERNTLATLEQLPIVTPRGDVVPLNSVVNLSYQRGFDMLRHTNTKLTIHVYAKVDNEVSNINNILDDVEENVMPDIVKKYGVEYSFEGKAEEQAETLTDMRYGMALALILIYIILAWVFSSYIWPIIVMLAIPLGLVGAIFGHWVMGLDLTILSLFGFFGLTGIVINDSIILISTYRLLKQKGKRTRQAIIDASCMRLRAVLLTSLTTIAGLTPLLFETSRQAQFLIPMAVSITFGLAFATVLILIIVPTLLSLCEDFSRRVVKKFN